MGILSKMKLRKTRDVKPEDKEVKTKSESSSPIVYLEKKSKKSKKSKSDYSIEKSLAMYITSLEVLMAIYFEEGSDFLKLYEEFRKEWKVEDMINKVASYDSLFKTAYREVNKWLKQ